jgi:hypothetical protein
VVLSNMDRAVASSGAVDDANAVKLYEAVLTGLDPTHDLVAIVFQCRRQCCPDQS